jgi:hypothetical protein
VSLRRRSKRRQAELDAMPVVTTVSTDRTPIRPEDASFREFVRRLPCVVCLKPTLGGDPCHLHTKRVAGDWLDDAGELVGNIYAGCRQHHAEQHDRGIKTFVRVHGVDLPEACKQIGNAYKLGWSAEGLGAAAIAARGYARVDVEQVLDGELPF